MRVSLILIALLAWTPAALGQPAAGGGENLILDQTGYFRSYYQFGLWRISCAGIKNDGEALFGKGKLEAAFKRYLRGRKVDWTSDDWMKDVRVYFFKGQIGDDTRAIELLKEIPPLGDWGGTDFDDHAWLRRRIGQRKPTRAYQENFRDFSDAMVRNLWVRTYCDLPDPARAGQLTLTLSYRGGVRVLVNGTEIARKDLPSGPLGDDARGAPYPRAAYVATAEEVPAGRYPGVCGDLRCPFDEAPPDPRNKDARETASRQYLNRNGWERLTALRDRTLGPLTIPANVLRAGGNVLAIEVRGSDYHPQILPGAGDPKAENWGMAGNPCWSHAELVKVQLRSTSPRVPSVTTRPAGARVWVDDMHARLYSTDFQPAGWPTGKVRIVGAPNGTFSAQLGLATDRELVGLKVAPAGLEMQGGTGLKPVPAIPASAMSISYEVGHPMNDLWTLGYCRSLSGLGEWGVDCPMALAAIYRQLSDKNQRAKGMTALEFFDHLTPARPEKVPPGRCQPIWLSLRVPPDAAPGQYQGAVGVEAEGMAPATVPVELEVVAWRVPGPMEFQTLVQSEQSPYGVAKHYKVPLWSDEHFRLIDTSFQQLARLGADWVFIPVLLNSEFGNKDDGMIRWTRRKDGTLAFEYAILDRYLDLAVKHLGAKGPPGGLERSGPRVICFNVMHGAEAATSDVKIFDEATGRDEIVNLGPKQAPNIRRPLWKAFATSLQAHLKARALEKSMYWGQAFDNVYDYALIEMLAEFTPGVYWAAAGHGRKPDANFRAAARAYGSDLLDRSQTGWASPIIHLLMPRTAGSIICVEGTSTPFTYRVMCDRAIYAGFNGIGRMGADYFDLAFYDGCKAGEYQLVGRSCIMTLWPGKHAVESGTRNEAMLEGIQEAEARIFLEQALDRSAARTGDNKVLPAELAEEVQKVLDDHIRSTMYIPTGPSTDFMEFTGDWQGRSLRLYRAAEKVARQFGLDADRTQIGARQFKTILYGRAEVATQGELVLPALGKVRVPVTLRNWTARPRKWRAAGSEAWIVPERTEGLAAGQEELAVTLDGATLTPGQQVAGTLTVTDVESGTAWPVKIAATVGKALELQATNLVFNVPAGSSESQEFTLVNHSAGELAWTTESSVPWMACNPASGKLAPGGATVVKVTAAPADKADAVYESELTLKAGAGAAEEKVAFRTYVIPPYRPPAPPGGEAVYLDDVSKKMLKAHRTRGGELKWWLADQREPRFGPAVQKATLAIGGVAYQHGMWVVPHHETTYNLEGGGYAAFAAEVGVNDGVRTHQYHVPGLRVNFEVYVDGRLRAQSGLMGDADPARLVVVDGLAGAKEIKLVTRMERLGDSPVNYAYPGYLGMLSHWADARFYKGK